MKNKKVIRMNQKQEKVLMNFLLNIDSLKKLDEWTNKFNIFDILKITIQK